MWVLGSDYGVEVAGRVVSFLVSPDGKVGREPTVEVVERHEP